MSTSFGEYSAPTDTIAGILASYPFSIGIFRELIQNSDDAGASKQVSTLSLPHRSQPDALNLLQIFLLDSRRHPIGSLYDPKLKNTQGPALLAFNDALFSEADWKALQSIHKSSKKADTTFVYLVIFNIGFLITSSTEGKLASMESVFGHVIMYVSSLQASPSFLSTLNRLPIIRKFFLGRPSASLTHIMTSPTLGALNWTSSSSQTYTLINSRRLTGSSQRVVH
jgi:hypothetical protein